MRIVVVTGFDSFASVILALKAGAVDYRLLATFGDRADVAISEA